MGESLVWCTGDLVVWQRALSGKEAIQLGRDQSQEVAPDHVNIDV